MSYLDAQGYRKVRIPGHPLADERGWVREHRAVAWDHFGPFDPSMHVHHKNHDRADNRPENLEVVAPEDHAAHHADERRKLYPDEVARLYGQGLTTIAIADRLGSHPGNISRVLARAGVRAQSKDERCEARYAALKPRVVAALRRGEPVGRLVREFGVPRSRVERWQEQSGIPPRRPGRPRNTAEEAP